MKTLLLKWWLFLCAQGVLAFTAFKFGFFTELLAKDITRMSFLILGVLLITTFRIGIKIYKHTKNNTKSTTQILNDISVLWFTGEVCLALGLVGTVLGFIIMLGTTFVGLDVTDTASMQDSLVKMSMGMSTALYTTLVGLLSSISIKIQLVNYERAVQKL